MIGDGEEPLQLKTHLSISPCRGSSSIPPAGYLPKSSLGISDILYFGLHRLISWRKSSNVQFSLIFHRHAQDWSDCPFPPQEIVLGDEDHLFHGPACMCPGQSRILRPIVRESEFSFPAPSDEKQHHEPYYHISSCVIAKAPDSIDNSAFHH